MTSFEEAILGLDGMTFYLAEPGFVTEDHPRRRVRTWADERGDRFAARDRLGARHRSERCEHAVWVDGKVEWITHEEGGVCAPFTGPEREYLALADL